MRIIYLMFLVVFTLTNTTRGDAIAPGIGFDAAKKTLQRHGYEADALKYGLDMASSNNNIALDFCRIDDEITLVISYDEHSKTVVSLALYIISHNSTSKLQGVFREALEISLEKNGVSSVKLRRKANKAKAAE